VLAPFLLLSIVFNRKLGGARDWDLLANLAVPAILLAADRLFESREEERVETGFPAAALFLLGVSVAHLAGIILVDVDPSASIRRVAALNEDGAPVSRFARSYALEEIGHYYVAQGRDEEAARWFERSAAVDSSNVKAIGTLGSYYASRGLHAEAVRLLESAVRQRPEVALNHYNLASALAEVERWDQAARSFSEAIRRDRGLLQAYSGLSLALTRQGRFAAADSVAQAGLRLFPGDPQNASLLITSGTARERLGRIAEAEAAYNEALRIDPTNREALFNLSRLYMDREAYAPALPLLQRLVSADPSDAEAAVNLGVASLHTGRRAEAADAWNRAIKANPRLPQPYMNLAALHHQAGETEEAARILEAFIAVDPGQAEALGFPALAAQLRGGGTAPR
jgi:tetratricopeptide (TPR) repeat protein